MKNTKSSLVIPVLCIALCAIDKLPAQDATQPKVLVNQTLIPKYDIWKIDNLDPADKKLKGFSLGSGGVVGSSADRDSVTYVDPANGKIRWKVNPIPQTPDVKELIDREQAVSNDRVVVWTNFTENVSRKAGYRLLFLDATSGKTLASRVFSQVDLAEDSTAVHKNQPEYFSRGQFVERGDIVYLALSNGLIKIDPKNLIAKTVVGFDRSSMQRSKSPVIIEWAFLPSGIFAMRSGEEDANGNSHAKIVKVNESGGLSDVAIFKDDKIRRLAALNNTDLMVCHKPPGSNMLLSRVDATTSKELWSIDLGQGANETMPGLTDGKRALLRVPSSSGDKLRVIDCETGKSIVEKDEQPVNGEGVQYWNVILIDGKAYVLGTRIAPKNNSLFLEPLESFASPTPGKPIPLGSIGERSVSDISHEKDATIIHFCAIQGRVMDRHGLIAIVARP